jgi:ABC-2 type transport system permease protein
MKIVSHILAFLERQLNLYKRFWKWELVWMVYLIISTLSIGFLGAGANEITGGDFDTNKYILYLLVGSLVWGYLSGIFWEMTEIVQMERWEDVIEYTFMAPVNRLVHLVSMAFFAIIYSILRTFILLVAMALVFNLDLSQTNYAGALTIMLGGSFAFIGLGMIMALFPLISPEKGQMVGRISEAVILIVSGIYYPISVLPGWMQSVAKLSPATYALEGMRAAILDGASTLSLLSSYVWQMLAAGVVLIPLGYFLFMQAEKFAKQHGKLTRSG